MQETTVHVRDKFDIRVKEQGTGDAVLFLHGAGGPMWDPLLEALSRSHRVIMPEHPGFGVSTGNEEIQDIHDLIYYYLDFLDAMKLDSVSLVGHSLGGMFAAELAAVQPRRVRKLALIAPVGLWNAAYPVLDIFAVTPQEMATAMFHDLEGVAAKGMGNMPDPATQSEAFIEFMVGRSQSMAVTAKYMWPIPNKGLIRRIHRISAPTLLVWGESDGLAPPQYGKDFQKLIAGSRLELVKEAGHAPQLEQPQRVIELIDGFLKG